MKIRTASYRNSKKKRTDKVIFYKDFKKYIDKSINGATQFAFTVILDFIGKMRDKGKSDTEILRDLEILIQRVKAEKSVFNLKVSKKFNKIALYTSCPILPSEKGVAFTDKNTYVSSLETNKFTSVVFLNSTLALCDLTFFNQPFNSAFDNNQFISNIADFLTKTDRKFNVADFPYFFKDNVNIVTTNLGLSGNAINLKNSLSKAGINTNIKRSLNASTDAIVIELFDDFRATPISIAVDENSFRVNDLLFDRNDSSLIYLSKGNVTILTILANDKKAMEKTIEILESKEISQNLIDDNLAVISGLKLEEEEIEE